jgi:hypothetical protein
MATNWYGKAAQAVLSKKIDLLNDDIKVMLVSSAYVPNVDTHGVKADVTGEITGTGYTAGGLSLASKTLTQNTTNNNWKFDAADLTFPALSGTFRYAVIYDNTHADKPLIGYVDFGSNQTATNQDTTIKWEYMFQDPDSGSIYSGTGILEIGY